MSVLDVIRSSGDTHHLCRRIPIHRPDKNRCAHHVEYCRSACFPQCRPTNRFPQPSLCRTCRREHIHISLFIPRPEERSARRLQCIRLSARRKTHLRRRVLNPIYPEEHCMLRIRNELYAGRAISCGAISSTQLCR